MTDELTPGEKEALKKLPRERLPSAGLEERVVGALRERGVLSRQRRRTVEITNSRVVGLLAACVALVIGAYSIGLHRGGGDQVLPGVMTVDRPTDDRGTVEAPTPGAPETPITDATEAKKVRSASDETRHAEPSATDAEKGDVTALKEEAPPEPRPTQAARSDEQTVAERHRSLGEQEEESAEIPVSQPQKALPPQETQASKVTTKESVRMSQPEGVATLAQPQMTDEPALVFAQTLSFLLDDTPVVVDIPDSVRITQDALGRTIISYTKDGPIRFRLAQPTSFDSPKTSSADLYSSTEEPPLVFAQTLSFLLDGTPVVVDAPENVRITQDDLSQMIIIYTKDGPIRFRLADDD